MQRVDFMDGYASVVEAYREVADRLGMEEPSMSKRIMDLLKAWEEILSDDFEFADRYKEQVLSEAKAVNQYNETVEYLARAIRLVDSYNIEVFAKDLFGTLENYLTRIENRASDEARFLKNELGEAGQSDPSVESAQNHARTASLFLRRVEQMDLSHQLRVATRLAQEAVREAQTAANEARNAAGFSAGSTLTAQFGDLAVDESKASKVFRGWTIVTVIVAVVLSFFLGPSSDAQVGQALFRIALLAGLLGLATYLGRQAAHHRDLATWAGTIKVQLLTFDGYVAPVFDQNLQDQMRVAFATRVFGSSPESKEEAGPTLGPPISELMNQFARGGAKP